MFNKNNIHGYQWTTIDHIMANKHCGVFLEMGLGKTVSTLTAIDKLINEELSVDTVLVVAPKRVAESVWAQEVENWSHLAHLKVSIVSGTEKQRRAALAQKADIYTIGRDNVAWLCGLYGGGRLPFDMLVLDELSSFKNHKSIRFKALRSVQAGFKRVVGLTGTPAPNSLMDLWAQVYLLDRGERLGKFITKFRELYFKPSKMNGPIVYSYKPQESGEERIYKKIGDICISMKTRDHLDLPERITNKIRIKMSASLKEAYDKFERERVMELLESSEEITALNAAALSNKLLQFANGAIYDADKNWHELHDMKIQEAVDIIENNQGKPVLIAWSFRHDMQRLMTALKKYKPVELKTDQNIKDWNAGKIQVMMMHPASGGHGLNLQKGGSTILWFGPTWSLELFEQFNARLDRQGQTETIVVNILAIEGTMDDDVLRAIDRKKGTQDGLMDAVKARITKYSKKL